MQTVKNKNIAALEENAQTFIHGYNYCNDKLYRELETAICSEDIFLEILYDFKEQFRLKATEIAAYTKLPRAVITAMLEGEAPNEQQRYAVVKYLRSISYYGSFSCIPDYIFSQLIKLLYDIFSPSIDKQSLAKLSGVSVNDISPIFSGRKNLTAKAQFDMLIPFYRLCSDSLNNSIEEYGAVAELLGSLLGTNMRMPDKRFADIYFTDCRRIEEETALSALSKIRPDDLRDILQGNKAPYYPKKLRELFYIMAERCEERKLPEKLNKADRMYLYQNSICGSRRAAAAKTEQETELEETEKLRQKKISDWFVTLPDILRELVFKYAIMQSKTMEYHWFYYDYITAQSRKGYYVFYSQKGKPDLILYVIRLFRHLSPAERNRILKELHKNLTLSLPFPVGNAESGISRNEKAKNCYSECAVFSFSLASMTKDKTLSEKYRDAPVNNSLEAMLYMKKHYRSAWSLDFTGQALLKEMLSFTAEEWQLAGYIETAIIRNFPVDFILDMIHKCFDDE